jgi:hypothetical protein
MISGITRSDGTVLPASQALKSVPTLDTNSSGPPMSPNHAMRLGTRPERYMIHPRISPFPNGTMNPGPNRNVQSLSAASETARSPASGESWRRLTTPSAKMMPNAMKVLSMMRAAT